MTISHDPAHDPHRRTAGDDDVGTGAMAGMALAALLVFGVMFYAFSGERSTTASLNKPAAEQSAPFTTGQGTPSP